MKVRGSRPPPSPSAARTCKYLLVTQSLPTDECATASNGHPETDAMSAPSIAGGCVAPNHAVTSSPSPAASPSPHYAPPAATSSGFGTGGQEGSSARIKVLGVGGGGGNALARMISSGLQVWEGEQAPGASP
jgi:cell division protein FtsZ